MPTHRIEFTATTVPADLPKDAKVTQVSKYPVVIERGGNTLELLAIPTKTATNKAKLAATIKIDGNHVELTEDTARTLARELFTLANDRQYAREKAEREERRTAELHAARLRAELFAARVYGTDRYGFAPTASRTSANSQENLGTSHFRDRPGFGSAPPQHVP